MSNPTSKSFTDEQLNKKMNQVFKWWDQNNDGYVTEDDVEKLASSFAGLADDTDEKNKKAMYTGIFAWWRLMLRKQEENNTKLAKPEFVRTMRGFAADPDDFKAAIGSVIDGMLGALDRNKDGVLSLHEYMAVYGRIGLSADLGVEAFKRLDRNSNGVIDHGEFALAIYEYYLSPDPDAPGQWLYGPPENFEL